MKILMVNKFLYPNGGSESYIFRLGEQLTAMGHEVWYFGMEDRRNVVGNPVGAYTKNVNFRGGGLSKLTYPFSIVYSRRARRQIAKVLDAFSPDVVHLNNINFQITPSVIYEVKKRSIPIVWTLHDYQLVCPNHMFTIPNTGEVCTRCSGGAFGNCIRHRCLHGSRLQSVIAAAEARLYRMLHTYRKVDKFICPSRFIEQKALLNPDLVGRTVAMHNFIQPGSGRTYEKEDYILYFGRFDREKGIETLLRVCRRMEDVQFRFAGSGELEPLLTGMDNVQNVGFQSGEALESLIGRARAVVYPAEWYENCPLSVMEAESLGTPVIASDIGGIPELVEDGRSGLLFPAGDAAALEEKIRTLYSDGDLAAAMGQNCLAARFDTAAQYAEKLIGIYEELK